MTTFEQLQERAEAAQREYERAYGQLFRDEARRERVYSDEEHEKQAHALRQERVRKVDAVVGEIRAKAEEAQKEIAALEGGDPTAVLGSGELAAAAARKPFVDDDVWTTPAENLAGKLRTILEGGDKAAVFAYSRAASSRFGPSWEKTPAGVGEALEEMRRFLAGPERLARAERARRTIDDAVGAELSAAPLKHGARGAADLNFERTFGSLAGR